MNRLEVKAIKNEYDVQKMTISQIADVHRRTPGSISWKLKNIGVITTTASARGYSDYKDSPLYKEVVASNKGEAEKKEAENKPKMEWLASKVATSEITELRKEIANIKEDIGKILVFMSDFCNSNVE